MTANSLFPGSSLQKLAVFSPCRRYRYTLSRTWDTNLGMAVFIGLNPSTADEHIDDPTIRRCIRFSRDWGFGGLVMLNIYGFRATNPKVMLAADDPVGAGNDDAIKTCCLNQNVKKIVAAWGAFAPQERVNHVLRLMERPLYALGVTKGGQPRHPLYVPAVKQPDLYWRP